MYVVISCCAASLDPYLLDVLLARVQDVDAPKATANGASCGSPAALWHQKVEHGMVVHYLLCVARSTTLCKGRRPAG